MLLLGLPWQLLKKLLLLLLQEVSARERRGSGGLIQRIGEILVRVLMTKEHTDVHVVGTSLILLLSEGRSSLNAEREQLGLQKGSKDSLLLKQILRMQIGLLSQLELWITQQVATRWHNSNRIHFK